MRQSRSWIFTVLCLLLFRGTCAFSQQPTLDELLAKAREIYTQRGPAAALPEYEQVLALYRAKQDRRGEAITLGLIGNCYKRLGDFPRALDYLQRALALKQELGDRLEEGKTLSHLGLVYWEMGEYGQAIEDLNRSLAIAREVQDRKLEGAALNNLSLVYDEQGDYRRSLEQYQRALELHRSTGFEQGESDTLGNIGGVYMTLGQFAVAMDYYRQALVISQRLQSKASESQDLENIALCKLGLGDLAGALGEFDRALAVAEPAGLKKEIADLHKGKGSVLVQMGKYDLAMAEYRHSRQVYEEAGLKKQLGEAASDQGALYLRLGDVVSAEKEFQRAVEVSRSIGYTRGVTANLLALGDVEWRRHRYEEASALYRQALERAKEAGERDLLSASHFGLAILLRDQGRWEEAQANARDAVQLAHETGATLLEAQGWYALGEIARRSGKLDDALESYRTSRQIAQASANPELSWQSMYGQGQALESLQRDEEALAEYKKAVQIIEDIRSQLREERFRAGYIEDKYQVYIALVRLLLKHQKIDQAFFYSEKLRARSYLDLLNRGVSSSATAKETELLARIRQLQDAIEREASKLASPQRQGPQLLNEELLAAQREYQRLLEELRSTRPEYVALRTVSVPDYGDIQSKLSPDTALLEYLVSDDTLTVFVLTGAGLHAKTVPVRAIDLQTKIQLFRDLISDEKNGDWKKPAASLHRLLVEPVEEEGWLHGISHLYLVPHGVLHYLPFAALPHQGTVGGRYLVEDYVLAYLPTAATLVYSRKNNAGQSLLALAPERSRLRFAAEEARSLGRLYPEGGLVLVGPTATESTLKREAEHYGVIHFATHGYFNRSNPSFSGLQLEADGQNDGRLEVHEILSLRLKTHLVTLSACETALGSGYFSEVPAGDEFVGLTRAFLFAGSDSVVASLWEVDDRSTMQLMGRFYRRLRSGSGAAALAEAQRDTLHRPNRYRHPYYWAPFVAVGAMN